MSDTRGLVLGVYSAEGTDEIRLTPFAQKYNETTSGQLLRQIQIAGPIKSGAARVFWEVGQYRAVAVAGLGDARSWSDLEEINGAKENVRIAAAHGAKALLSQKITSIDVEDMECAKSAAEGAILGTFTYQGFKAVANRTPTAAISLADGSNGAAEWAEGVVLANCQNWTRTLMDTPANLMTPSIFAENVAERCKSLNISVEAHGEDWARAKKMHSFLSVSAGSHEPAVFVEMTYNGAADPAAPPICFVGKGITFDSGGISLKNASKMDVMRADMGGAANVAATIVALAELRVPVNIKGLLPLSENMPSGSATKPGDVVYAMNGKSICVDDTDYEGRLVMCDAICYANAFKPKFILDIATLTLECITTFGDCAVAAFTNSQSLWEHLRRAGSESGDRVWRLPLFKRYADMMTHHRGYDINNICKEKGAGSCTAAAFLRQFVADNVPWVHIDMASVMAGCEDQSYTGADGMSGRPMRTLYEFVCGEAELH